MRADLSVDSEVTLPKLRTFPNYITAPSVNEVDASSLTHEEFMRTYVFQSRPCLIRNAVSHWKACDVWGDTEYLRSNSTDAELVTRTRSVPEMVEWACEETRARLEKEVKRTYRVARFHTFLDAIEANDDPIIVDACSFTETSALHGLRRDIGRFEFMPSPSASRFYPAYRAFLYRKSYTDWHFHSTDDTLVAQVVGTKEVMLLPPDRATWEAISRLLRDCGVMYDIDTQRYPETEQLRPFRVVVRPGDALYVPTFWWHAVESIGESFGATVSATFRTPLRVNGDLRKPMAKHLLRKHLLSKYAPFIVAAIATSFFFRLIEWIAPRRK